MLPFLVLKKVPLVQASPGPLKEGGKHGLVTNQARLTSLGTPVPPCPLPSPQRTGATRLRVLSSLYAQNKQHMIYRLLDFSSFLQPRFSPVGGGEGST